MFFFFFFFLFFIKLFIYIFTEIIFDSNKRDRSLFDNCEHVIRLMEKFLFIAAPVTIREELASTASVGEEQVQAVVMVVMKFYSFFTITFIMYIYHSNGI